MTMSRMAVVAVLALWAAPLSAQQTADQAIAAYEEKFGFRSASRCVAATDPAEIVVCGQREGNGRFRVSPRGEPGQRVVGDLSSGTAAMSAGGCISRCAQPLQVDLIKAVPAVINGIRRILNPDR